MKSRGIKPTVIAGEYKGRRLDVPNKARPLTGRLKMVIFDTLGDYIQDSVVVDLYAGSGSFGIEAISRGAKFVHFVDKNKLGKQDLVHNTSTLGIPKEKFHIYLQDILSFASKLNEKVDLVFADPPFPDYKRTKVNKMFNMLKDHGVLVIRYPKDDRNKSMIELEKYVIAEKVVGKSKISFLQNK